MSEQSGSGIDREGVGMLYALGTGIMVGASVTVAAGYSIASILGGAVVACGLGYEMYQRSLQTETNHGGHTDD